jgi:hypothetical protein
LNEAKKIIEARSYMEALGVSLCSASNPRAC